MSKLDPHFVEMAALVADEVCRRLYDGVALVSPWLDPEECAEYLGLTERGLENYRRTGGGPKFDRPAHKVVRYHVKDLDAWVRGEAVAK